MKSEHEIKFRLESATLRRNQLIDTDFQNKNQRNIDLLSVEIVTLQSVL